MSVYEQIASRTRTKRHRKAFNEQKLDEQVEEIKDGDQDDEDDDEDRSSVVLQVSDEIRSRLISENLGLNDFVFSPA